MHVGSQVLTLLGLVAIASAVHSAVHAADRLDRPKRIRPYCGRFEQSTDLRGYWVHHEDPNYVGLYNQSLDCPHFGAAEFNCWFPFFVDPPDYTWLHSEYNKVFKPRDCELHEWDSNGFAECIGNGNRLIMIGGSLMRQSFESLACLLRNITVDGKANVWSDSGIAVTGDYTQRGGLPGWKVLKQHVGDLTLRNGAQIRLRSFGRFNLTLWDDVLAEFQPLTKKDVLLVNFGAWYPRFKISDHDSWEMFKVDMPELFHARLTNYPCRVVWKEYAPTHFGGATGAYTGVEEMLGPGSKSKADPGTDSCYPASVGEYWYDDFIRELLHECGASCAHIQMLPIYDLSLMRHHLHHGSLGRGRPVHATDCRHYCTPVVDTWNIVLYNLMCF